jgi:hypothetical protein
MYSKRVPIHAQRYTHRNFKDEPSMIVQLVSCQVFVLESLPITDHRSQSVTETVYSSARSLWRSDTTECIQDWESAYIQAEPQRCSVPSLGVTFRSVMTPTPSSTPIASAVYCPHSQPSYSLISVPAPMTEPMSVPAPAAAFKRHMLLPCSDSSALGAICSTRKIMTHDSAGKNGIAPGRTRLQ